MDLEAIRRQLDILDRSLMYILVKRMSLMPLVVKAKKEKGLPAYQPDREKSMYASMELFAKETGLNPDMLSDVFKVIIKDAIRIQEQSGDSSVLPGDAGGLDIGKETLYELESSIESAGSALRGFLTSMEESRLRLSSESDKAGLLSDFLTGYYRTDLKQ